MRTEMSKGLVLEALPLHRVASEDVILQLIRSKCVAGLLHVLEACPLNKSNTSFDFVVDRFL